MRVTRMLGVCLIAVIAIFAVSVSAAQAEQFEFGHCAKTTKNAEGVYPGHYSDKNCTEEVSSGGRYEFTALPEGSAVKQAGKGKGMTLTVPSTGASVVCTKSKSELTLTGPKEGEGSVTFEKCGSEGKSCNSEEIPGANRNGTKAGGGTILAGKVKIKLDYEPPKTVSIEIVFGKNVTDSAFVINCGGTTTGFGGSTDGLMTSNVDVMSTKSFDAWSGPGNLFVEQGGVRAPAELSATLQLKNEKLEVKTHE